MRQPIYRFMNRTAVLRLLLVSACLGFGLPSVSGAERKPRETRAVWVVRTDLKSPESIREVVRTASRSGLNTLIVQVRGRGDAWYRSSLEPRAPELGGQPEEFDPLATVVWEAKSAGLRVHAWLNATYIWSDPVPPTAAQHILNAHPDWIAVDAGRRTLAPGAAHGVFICPSNPEARRHLVEVYSEVARGYDLDGIQMDYIRYPDARTCHCGGCRLRFARSVKAMGKDSTPPGGSCIRAYPTEWMAWRREQITSLVREIREGVRRENPRLILSAAVIPWGTYSSDFRQTEAYRTCAQDWDGWLRSGLIDVAVPMTYQTSVSAFSAWVHGIRRAHPNRQVWFGIGSYLCTPESSAEKISIVRRSGAGGWSLFSYTSVAAQNEGAYLRALSGHLGLKPARR